jgi:hypothetical protein
MGRGGSSGEDGQWRGGRERAEADDEVGGGEIDLEAAGEVGAEAEVDVVPEDGGVTAGRNGGVGDGARVGVTLEDGEAGGEGEVVEGVGDLAEAAAGGGDDAAAAEFATGGEAVGASGARDVGPEAEDLTGDEVAAVESAAGEAEIVDLAGLEGELGGVGGGEQGVMDSARMGVEAGAGMVGRMGGRPAGSWRRRASLMRLLRRRKLSDWARSDMRSQLDSSGT